MSDPLRDGLDQFYQAQTDAGQAIIKARRGGCDLWRAHKSDALAVHPNQIKEATEDARKKGVPTDFSEDGRPIFTSRRHLRDYCVAYGFYNRGAGYSDAQPNSFKGKKPDVFDLVDKEAVAMLYGATKHV